MEKSMRAETEKWNKLLRSLIDVKLFLVEHGLPFRGSHSTPKMKTSDCPCPSPNLLQSVIRTWNFTSKQLSVIEKSIKEYRPTTCLGEYVHENYKCWEVHDRFLKIVDYEKKKGVDIAEEINYLLA
ncbi:hypothetical protein PR048_029834 [Dryococelus australis]|uniref:Uncharacterized protein n=1 Tax=Dryococelus australis TaxID=614101 RepID=A0ABQ9GA61_9NEOP|nr:hypothetical protein PR048_029834 [Dryococelus australis]